MTSKKVETKDDILNSCMELLFPENKYPRIFIYEKVNHALQKLNSIDLYSIRERLKEICKT
jgi:hypothetical protein